MLPSVSPEPPTKRPRITADPIVEARGSTQAEASNSTGGGHRAAPQVSPSITPTQPACSTSGAQPSQLQAPHSLAAGATAILPTSLPAWAEEALVGVDPFWRPKEVLAVITTRSAAPAPGTHGQLQSASALFTVSPSALEEVKQKKAQARLVCVQPEDGPPNRCHWYGGSYVLLNQQPYEVTKEDRVQLLLGVNQADQAADLSGGLQRGANKLTLLWPIGVVGAVAVLRLCEPVAPADLMTRLAPPLPLGEAVQLVRAHVAMGSTGDDEEEEEEEDAEKETEEKRGEEKSRQGDEDGGGATEVEAAREQDAGGRQDPSSQEGSGEYTGGSRKRGRRESTAAGGGEAGSGRQGQTRRSSPGGDSTAPGTGDGDDGEALGSGPVSVSLRCPLHGGLVASPAHFGASAPANPLAFFDVAAFLEVAKRTGSWVCPATARLGGLQDLRPHAFLTAVLRTLDHNGVRQRVEAIEVAPCGSWRPKDSRVPFLSFLTVPGASGDGASARGAVGGVSGWVPPQFDTRLLDPEEDAEEGRDVVDLTDG